MYSDGFKNISDAMTAAGLKRIIVVSAERDNPHAPFLFRTLVAKVILRNIFHDMNVMEELVKASSFDFTIVRPFQLVDAPAQSMASVSANSTIRAEQGERALPEFSWMYVEDSKARACQLFSVLA